MRIRFSAPASIKMTEGMAMRIMVAGSRALETGVRPVLQRVGREPETDQAERQPAQNAALDREHTQKTRERRAHG